MKFSEARQGRIFILRLEDGDSIHEVLEGFAAEQGIRAAALMILGGADQGSRLVVGPENGRSQVVRPMEHVLDGVHEVSGTGTLFPGEDGKPLLHMHMACGRQGKTATGCVRRGVKVWHIMEVILFELTHTHACRIIDPSLGFKLLQP